MGETIKWLKDINENDSVNMGYKATRLGELLREKYPIPRAFGINSKVYFNFLGQNNLKEKINEIIKTIDFTNKQDIANKSEEIRKLFFKNKETDDLRSELEKMYNKVGESMVGWLNSKIDDFVAIRASLTSEDYPQTDLDFIEKQCGYINIKGFDNVILNIKECWFSMFIPDVLEYMHNKSIDYTKIGMAIIIQKMVNAKVSGVMITSKAPLNNTVIEAVFGLGGSTIIQEITPDHYETSKKNLDIIKKTKTPQEWLLKRVLGKTVKAPMDPREIDKQKLEAMFLKELTSMAKKLEAHYKIPLVVDWAFEKADLSIISADPLDPKQKETKRKKQKESFQEKIDSFNKELILEGIPIFSGIANGYVRIINSLADLKEPATLKDIIVIKMTNGSYSDLLKGAGGIVTDVGSALCHAALLSEKYSIPCVVNTREATTTLRNGQYIQINGTNGSIYELRNVAPPVSKVTEVKKGVLEINLDREAELPETITKIIVKLHTLEDISTLNFKDIDGVLINLKALFTLDELHEIVQNEDLLILNIKAKLKSLLKVYPKDKLIYYRMHLHQESLVSEDVSHFEIEGILEVAKDAPNLSLVIDNVKSVDEFTFIKATTGLKSGITITDINKPAIIEQYLPKGMDFVFFDFPEIREMDKLKLMFDMCKLNKIIRITDIKENYADEHIKAIVELKTNAVTFYPEKVNIKETIYKKEKEMLKSLLSI